MSRIISNPEWATQAGMVKDYDEHVIKARKARRRARRNRFIGYVLAAVVGLGVGTLIVNATEADAITQAQINRYIKSENGIPPCRWEDGSGTPGVGDKSPCYWNAKTMGDGNGWSFVAMPDGKDKDDDKDIVYLNGPDAVRY